MVREAHRTGEGLSEVRARIETNPVELAKIASIALDALALKRPVDREDVMRRVQEIVDERKGERGERK
jgi:hypothetical protein